MPAKFVLPRVSAGAGALSSTGYLLLQTAAAALNDPVDAIPRGPLPISVAA